MNARQDMAALAEIRRREPDYFNARMFVRLGALKARLDKIRARGGMFAQVEFSSLARSLQ